jgi:Zn-dependent protease with chaperone function
MRDFFEQQAAAQRRTRLLLLCMLLSALVMSAGFFGGLYAVRAVLLLRFPPSAALPPALRLETLAAWSFGSTLALVAVAALVRIWTLRHGGSSIAEMLDARLVTGQPQNQLDRRLLNVVSEMALAAGTPVPQVYVLDREVSINAFAAGWTLGDSVICITRGCLHKLTRAELEGVIAHELSHLLHGDARLNLLLMGAVYGMVFISLLGKSLMRPRESVSRADGNSQALGFLLGGFIAAVGSLGALLGKLVKAAVSRQREYLADAAAVQFTRNPAGLAGALKKVGGFELGGRLSTTRGGEAEHFFLDETGPSPGWSWLTTHPSLARRIALLDPGFDGQFVAPAEGVAEAVQERELQPSSRRPAAEHAREAHAQHSAEHILPLVGTGVLQASRPSNDHAMPDVDPTLRQACESGFSACSLVFALLVSTDNKVGVRQAQRIVEHAGPRLLAEAQRLHGAVSKANRVERLTLATLAAPALRTLSANQKLVLRRTVDALIAEDGKTSIFELVLGHMLAQHWTNPKPLRAKPNAGLAARRQEARVVLSCLAHAGATGPESAGRAFQAACAKLPGMTLDLLPTGTRLLSAFTTALDELQTLRPTARAALVDACAHATLADSRVTEDELTLLRAVCLALDAPLPPLDSPTSQVTVATDGRCAGLASAAEAEPRLQGNSKWS